MPNASAHGDPSQAARKVELIIAQLDSLPTLPRIATQLLRLTRSDKSSTRQVIELIKQDQALTAKILSLARRAGSGIRGDVTTVDKCVVLMGLEAVRNAALSIKIFEIFDPNDDGGPGGFDLAGFWLHSLAVAVACERIAAMCSESPGKRGPCPEELFTAGLLHDVGKAALHYALPKSYAKVMEATARSAAPLQAIERKLIGIDHTVVGKRLAQKWHLPEGVVDAMWLHHTPPGAMPESVTERGFAPIVQVADVIVREMRLGFSGNAARPASGNQLAGALGLRPEQVEAIRRELPDQLASRASVIGMDQLDSRDVYYDALQSANGELGRLNARLLARGINLSQKTRFFEAMGTLGRELPAGARPVAAAEVIGRVFAKVAGAERVVIFSEPPDQGNRAMIEGVVLDAPDRVAQAFVLDTADDDIDGLAAARAGGWFDPDQSADGFAMFPLDGHMGWVHHRLDESLPLDGAHLVPLPADGTWAGGVVLSAGLDNELRRRWPACRGELFALAACAGAAMRSAQLASDSDRLAEELARSAEQLAEAQTALSRQQALAAVGQMAAGAGHELNNPLQAISGRSEMLAGDEQNADRREALEAIHRNAQRASDIISELMTFAQPPAAHPQTIDMQKLARELAEPMRKAQIEVEISSPPNLPRGWADPAQLREALQEIIDNAQQAMAGQQDRRLTVQVSEVDSRLELVIIDNGEGMDARVLERATDPFFSARPAGRGRGLGLARARRLVEHNGGELLLESESGVGTTVRVLIPTAEAD